MSPTSLKVLKIQGGVFTKDQCDSFEKEEHFEDAVKLCLWEEEARSSEMITQDFDYFTRFMKDVYETK